MIHVSFYHTTAQYHDRKKDITRRVNSPLSPCQPFMGVKQMRGLKKGDKRVLLGESVCIYNEPERVDEIIKSPRRKCLSLEEFRHASLCCRYRTVGGHCSDISYHGYLESCIFTICPGIYETDREGFQGGSPIEFADMLCKMNKIKYSTVIRRVVFKPVSRINK